LIFPFHVLDGVWAGLHSYRYLSLFYLGEYSNTPRFVLTISPPIDWTTPANSDSSFTNIDAGPVPVMLITTGTASNLDEATSNAVQDIQDAVFLHYLFRL
jgi:hypothetical protein